MSQRLVPPAHGIAPPPVPYDPELLPGLHAFLDTVERIPLTADTIIANRAVLDAVTPSIEQQVAGRSVEWEHRTVPGFGGDPDIEVTIVRQGSRTDAQAPAILSIHGGGMILGTRFFSTPELVDYAERFGAVGVSVEYRLAPEHPGPAQARDCYAALVWMVASAEELGIDPERIVVAGVSAGGGLAAATALMARDLGEPRIAGLVVSNPMLDERNATVSAHQYDGFGAWDRGNNDTAWNAVCGATRGTDAVSAYTSPSHAQSLAGLPPVFVDAGAAETFRDEAVEFASRIWATGGRAELHVWAGGHHGFAAGASDTKVGKAANEAQESWLVRMFGSIDAR